MTMNSLHELLVHELRDLYGAEQQLSKALPKMAKASTSEALAKAFLDHLEDTDRHVTRLKESLTLLGETPSPVKCKGMEGLLKEGTEMMEEEGNELVRDAGLIGAAQRVEHYEVAAYGTSIELASVLGEDRVVALLRKTLDEEKAANQRLTEIAERDVNPKAMLSSVAA